MNNTIAIFSSIIILITACTQNQKLPNHSRIIFTPELEKKVIQKLDTDEISAQVFNMMKISSDRIMQLPTLEREQEGRRILAVSREALRRIGYLATVYRITKDEKYLKRAEAELLAVSNFSDWNPSHFLDVAEMTLACAIGYDWLYSHLKDDTKSKIKEAIIEKGLKASLEENGWSKSDNNWNQVCNAGMAIGALAVYEDVPELANQMIERVKESIKIPLKVYEPDGAYPEGPTYWAYGTNFHVLLLDAYRSVFGNIDGFEITESLIKSAEYQLHVMGNAGFFNYSDCGLKQGIMPATYWFAGETQNSGLLYHQKKAVNDLISIKDADFQEKKLKYNRLLPFMLFWSSKIASANIQSPSTFSWQGNGINPVAMHRSSWDSTAIFIGVKGGKAHSHHAHMDAGSFIMEANGVRWAHDLGMHEYHKLESQGLDIWSLNQNSQRWTIMRYTNFFHNTLTVDDSLHRVEGKAEFIRHRPNEFSILNLTDVFKGQLDSVLRGVALVDSSYVFIQDRVTNNEKESTIRWSMVTFDNILLKGNSAIISEKGTTLQLRVVSPKNAILKTWTTDPLNSFEDKNHGKIILGFETTLSSNQTQTFRVYLLPQTEEEIKIKKVDLF